MSDAKSAAAVALLLVLAGCSGGTQPAPSPTAATAPQPTTGIEHATTPPPSTASPTTREPTAMTTAVSPSNPWQTDTVVVSVTHQNQSSPPARHVDAVRNATTYWNAHYDEYSPFRELQFVVRENATNADVLVAVSESVTNCNGTTNDAIVGCGEVYEPGDVAQSPTLVKIEAGYTTAFTTELVRHEFGHLLGLEHGDEPMPLMAAGGQPVPRNEENATERSPTRTTRIPSTAVSESPPQRQRVLESLP